MQAINTQQVGDDKGEVGPSKCRDRAFEILSNVRRRQVLRYLRTHGGDKPIIIRELAEQIAAWENNIPPAEVTYKQRKRVYTSLYQSHLPRLHRYGYIEYDADRGTVEPTPASGDLDIHLEAVPKGRLPWSEVYLGTSAVAAAFAAALYIGALPFVTSWHAFTLFVFVFGSISVVHTIKTRQITPLDE